MSPAQRLWGGNKHKTVLLLCPLHLESPLSLPASAPGSFCRFHSFGSTPSRTGKSIDTYSDTDSLVSEGRMEIEVPTNSAKPRKEKRRKSTGEEMPGRPPHRLSGSYQLRDAKQNSIESTTFPRFFSATGPSAFSSTATLKNFSSYSIPSEEILVVLHYTGTTPVGGVQVPRRIGVSTKSDGYFDLYFDNQNSHDVILVFLQSCVKKDRIHVSDEQGKNSLLSSDEKGVSKSSCASSKFLLAKSSSGELRALPASSSSTTRGSFDVEKFQERKMKDHVNNESAFERMGRKIGYMSSSVGECKCWMLTHLDVSIILQQWPYVTFLFAWSLTVFWQGFYHLVFLNAAHVILSISAHAVSLQVPILARSLNRLGILMVW